MTLDLSWLAPLPGHLAGLWLPLIAVVALGACAVRVVWVAIR